MDKALKPVFLFVLQFLILAQANAQNLNDLDDSSALTDLVLGRETSVIDLVLGETCDYFGYQNSVLKESMLTYSSNDEAIEVVKRITDSVGLPQNFVVRSGEVPNATAHTNNEGTRMVVYNESFMTAVAQATQTDWSSLSILAHEVGHHLSGHTLTSGGSRPALEIEADRFSGFIVARLGGSLAQAQSAMRAFAGTEGSSTHPGKRDRLDAISAGWEAGNSDTPNSSTVPATTGNEQCRVTRTTSTLPVHSLQNITVTGQAFSRDSACSEAEENMGNALDTHCSTIFSDNRVYSRIQVGAVSNRRQEISGDFTGYACAVELQFSCVAQRTEVIETLDCQ